MALSFCITCFQFVDYHTIFNIRNAEGNPVTNIVDGNQVNYSFFKRLDLTEPWFTNNGVISLHDDVHLLKYLGNNWVTEGAQEINFVHKRNVLTARWGDWQELFKLEKGI